MPRAIIRRRASGPELSPSRRHKYKKLLKNKMIPVTRADLEIGKPLPWNIYDPLGNRLAAAKEIISSTEHLHHLLDIKVYRDPDDALSQDEPGDEDLAPHNTAQDGSYTFEAMKLKVGDRIQIHLPARFAVDRVIVRLIGYVNNLSLLVTLPRAANGFRMPLEESDELAVRIFTSQNAFGFTSAVEKIIKLPFEYMHISFPCEVSGMVIRKAPRVKTKIICSIMTEQSGGEKLTGIFLNLSVNGALLASQRAVAPKGEVIKLTFRVLLHGTEAMLNLHAVVRAQFADETPASPTPVHHGLEFVDLQPKDALVLQSLIYQQMIEKPHSVM